MLRVCAALMVLACVVPAEASSRHGHHYHRAHRVRAAFDANGGRVDPRPRAWCGWWLRHHLGVADRHYNEARAWARYGQRAGGAAPGVIAVYRHHVGIVVSVPGPGRMVMKSGNDGHAVRTRERSTRGVIAWRWPPQKYAGL